MMPEPPAPAWPPAVSLLEDLTLSFWPALGTVFRDGWVIRFAEGHTGRANSACVLHPGSEPVAAKVDHVEALYRAQGLAPLFRMTPLASAALDDELDRRGYDRHKPTHVLVLDRLPGAMEEAADLLIGTRPDMAWDAAYATMVGLGPEAARAQRRLQEAILLPAFYAAVTEGGVPVSVALAVVDRGWAGIFEVATRPDRRGRGLARRAVDAALSAASSRGATRAFLQVMAHNAPAIRVYERMGFIPAYDYVYRTRKA
jgi:ribosomal protein S18 acetylase RimI-like enzyme